jgi:signal peptidase II
VAAPRPALIRPWLTAAGLLAGDQLSKWLIMSWLRPGDSFPLINGIVHLTYVQNTGMAFGLFRGFPQVFAVLAVAVAAWIGWELTRSHRMGRPMELGLSLILGGAIGNLIDRVRLGYVIDFIDLRVWPVFNVADSAITIGVVLLLWQSFIPPKAPTDASHRL